MSFQPVSGTIRVGTGNPQPPAAAAAAPKAGDPAGSYHASGHARISLGDRERMREAALPDQLAAQLRGLRGSKSSREMREAIPVATERLAFVRARVEQLEAERLSYLRSGAARAIPAIDEKLGLWRAFLEGYQLLIADFETAIPQREANERAALADFCERAARIVAKRQAAANALLAQREMLAEFVKNVQIYDNETKQLGALVNQLVGASFATEEINLDLREPLTVSAPVQASQPERMGLAIYGLAASVRLPGIAARGEGAPPWLYLPNAGII
jgi:hypothetical protein